jgi:hypothetical protein
LAIGEKARPGSSWREALRNGLNRRSGPPECVATRRRSHDADRE